MLTVANSESFFRLLGVAILKLDLFALNPTEVT